MAGSTAVLAIKIISDAKAAIAGLEQTSAASGRMSKAGALAGKALAGGVILAGAAAVKFGKQASDLAETQSKVNQIFGTEGAAALDKFASTAATKLGQSKQEALDAAASFGVFGKAAGLQGPELAGFSSKLTTLASDMASFNNTSPAEAAEAIGAALRGESEPIRKYGVMLNEATLQNEALRLGLIKRGQTMSQGDKVLAAQAAIMRQTKDQQGDFARTSDGLANQQRILQAQFKDLTTELGQKAVPVLLKLAEAGLAVVGWIDRNRTLAGVLIGTLGGLLAITWAVSKATAAWSAATKIWSAVTKIAAGVQWLFNAAMAANPVTLVVIAIVALVAVLVLAWKKSETFRKIVIGAWNAIKKATSAVWNAIKSAIKAAWSFILKVATTYVRGVLAGVKAVWNAIKKATSFVWNAIKAYFKGVWNGIKTVATTYVNTVKKVVTTVWNAIKTGTSRVWEAIKTAVKTAFGRVVDTVTGLKDKVVNVFKNAGAWLWDAGKRILQGLIDGIQEMVGKVKDKLGEVTGLIPDWKGPATRDRGLLNNAGRLIMQGLVDGIRAEHGAVKRALTDVSGLIEAGVSPTLTVAPRLAGATSSRTAAQGGGDTYRITINGAVDPDSTARQIDELLTRYRRRRGQRV